MKEYLDRKRMGISEIFASIHPIFSPSSDLDAEETVRLLCEQSRYTRHKTAVRLNEAIRRLTADRTVDVEDYLNDDIRELAQYPLTADGMDRLLPLMKWLMELNRQNALAADRSQYALNDAANHMERAAGEFLRTCSSSMMWHHISFAQEDGGILMTFRERFWGKAGLFFPCVETEFIGAFPLVGLLFSVEAEHADNRFAFAFVVNVEFGTDDAERRVIQDRNWIRLSFRCDEPQLRLHTFDYGRLLLDFGRRGHGFLDDWCGELLSKETVLGSASLSGEESALLPLAGILRMAYQMADSGSANGEGHPPAEDGDLSEKVLETLANRYRFRQFEQLLRETGQEDLYKPLLEAMEAWEADLLSDTGQCLWRFARLLRQKERNDSLRPLYRRIMEEMCACTAAFGDKSRLYGTYAEAQEKMRALIEPHLLSLGFTGKYPHYRRRRGRRGEYISVLTSNVNSRTVNGVMTYYFSLSAAVKKLEKRGRRAAARYFAEGIPFEETTAEDCRGVFTRHGRFAELGGMYDGESAEIHVDVFEGLSGDAAAADTAHILNRFADVADGAMKGKRMPHWYRKKRRHAAVRYKPETTLNETFMHYLPFGVYLAVLLLAGYIVCDRLITVTDYVPMLTGSLAVSGSLLAGLLLPLLCAAARHLRMRGRIWRY